MIKCYRKINFNNASTVDRWILDCNYSISHLNGGPDYILEAKGASIWCLGKRIKDIYFEVNGVDYQPKTGEISIIEKELLEIAKHGELIDKNFLKDEDFLI
jgi:hypothetical protein